MAAAPNPRPDPDSIEATFVGTGKAGQIWRLSLTADRAFFLLDDSDERFSKSRAELAAELNIGALGRERATILFKRPEPRVLAFPKEGLEYLYGWLSETAREAFRQRILRAGWGSTLVVGLLFLLPLGELGTATYLTSLSGALLLVAALVSRFGKSPLGFLLRALGWGVLGALLLAGVLLDDRSPWLLLLVGLLGWGVWRYVRLYGFFAERPDPP